MHFEQTRAACVCMVRVRSHALKNSTAANEESRRGLSLSSQLSRPFGGIVTCVCLGVFVCG